MIELADKTFTTKGPMTYAEISKKWNVEDPFVICDYINHWQSVRDMNTSLELYNRAMYILTEAKRVQDFQAVCENTNLSEDEKLQ